MRTNNMLNDMMNSNSHNMRNHMSSYNFGSSAHRTPRAEYKGMSTHSRSNPVNTLSAMAHSRSRQMLDHMKGEFFFPYPQARNTYKQMGPSQSYSTYKGVHSNRNRTDTAASTKACQQYSMECFTADSGNYHNQICNPVLVLVPCCC